jgi:hypothetical protein
MATLEGMLGSIASWFSVASERIWRGSVHGTSFHGLSVDNTTTLLALILTGSFVTGGGTDSTIMEKMDVDDDAVVDLSVKYVH